MSRARLFTAALATSVLLSGCGAFSPDSGAPPTKTDPREGRVTITWSNCATGNCIYDWKICVGPDLEVHIGGDKRTVPGSKECAS